MQCIHTFKIINGRLAPFVLDDDGNLVQVGWAPMPGSQEAFLKCTEREVLYHGPRGTGKSECLVACFVLNFVGKGFGTAAKGVIIRRNMPSMIEVNKLATDLIRRVCPNAVFNQMTSTFTFPEGETLRLSHFDSVETDGPNFLGATLPFVGFEELVMWPNAKCWNNMYATNRPAGGMVNMPRMMRATTNPYGVGHNWIMQRYRLQPGDQTMVGPAILDSVGDGGEIEPSRRAIRAFMGENIFYAATMPDYKDSVAASAQGNEALYKAHVEGEWGITAGGMFDDIWTDCKHAIVVPPFEVPYTWPIYRALDFGTSRPGVCLWYAISNGDDIIMANGRVRSTLKGDIYILAEVYLWNGRADEGLNLVASEQATRFREFEQTTLAGRKIRTGPADLQIFSEDMGPSVASYFEKGGVPFEPCVKGPYSRPTGWELMRERFRATTHKVGDVRSQPGLFISEACPQCLRTIPVLQRDEKKSWSDVDTNSEDHCGDCVRYILTFDVQPTFSGRIDDYGKRR